MTRWASGGKRDHRGVVGDEHRKKSDRYIQGAIAYGVFLLLLGFSPAVWAQPAGMLKAYGSAVTQGEYE